MYYKNFKDKLRACVIDFMGNWNDHMPLIEISYNSIYHSNIQMASYEALHRIRCKSIIWWFDVGETESIGLNLVHQVMEKVNVFQERLKIAQRLQKSYPYVRIRPLEFEVHD